MKVLYVFALICFGLIVSGGQLVAQTEVNPRSNTILLGFGTDTHGFSVSYEKMFQLSKKNHRIGFRGFVGYGFNSSNWSDLGTIPEPNTMPGALWKTSTYRPFEIEDDNKRISYYLGDLKEYSLGVALVNMTGKKHHFIEGSLGISLDYFTRNVNFYANRKSLGQRPTFAQLEDAKGSRWASHWYLSLGYRFIANNGFTAGVGLNSIYLQGPFTYFYAAKTSILPYLSLGYAF